MWIFLKDGFFSVIEHPDSKKHVVIRARVKGDIEKVFPENGGVEMTEDSDYRFRAPMTKDRFASHIAQQATLINYKNFKNSINDKERREYWYEEVWNTMANMQDHLATLEDIEKVKA